MRLLSVNGSAHVTVQSTLTVTYTQARCPSCNRLILEAPGVRVLEARNATRAGLMGRGVVVKCGRCGDLVEVVAHD